MLRNARGYTLIEIMTVVGIIGFLAVLGLPNFLQARNSARASMCVNNMRIISAAKDQDALENNLAAGAPSPNYLNYIKNGVLPVCPAGGTYTINVIGTNPTCSIGGTHDLS